MALFFLLSPHHHLNVSLVCCLLTAKMLLVTLVSNVTWPHSVTKANLSPGWKPLYFTKAQLKGNCASIFALLGDVFVKLWLAQRG